MRFRDLNVGELFIHKSAGKFEPRIKTSMHKKADTDLSCRPTSEPRKQWGASEVYIIGAVDGKWFVYIGDRWVTQAEAERMLWPT